jgi:choline dehydrogenase-like flavoprotein
MTTLSPVAPPAAPALGLTRARRRTLDAVCDTFAPGGDGLPSATELGVPEAIVEAVAGNARAADRRAFEMALTALGSRVGAGGPRRLPALAAAGRERVLLSWCDSRLGFRRAAFQALRRAALVMYHLLPAPDGGPNPTWPAMGYGGPLGPLPGRGPRTITPTPVTGAAELECDVCVVGSGAGGGTAAGVLAAAGLDVVVLEAGGDYDDEDFDGGELDGYRRLYANGGGMATADQGIGLLAGACLGGGTTVNYTTSFRPPPEVRREWAALGVPAFAGEDYDRSLDAVWERLGVNVRNSEPCARDRLLLRGLETLGWHAAAMPRNVDGCDARSCGSCAYGCREGAKRSTVKTWLADAHARGARILVDSRAERVLLAGGAARGVLARTRDGHTVTVRSRAVVVACGAFQTPALLRRSGLRNANVGRHLRLHPATGVCGVFDEPVRAWEGMLASQYSDEHAHLDGAYGVKYETGGIHPSLFAFSAPWRGARQFRALMEDVERTLPLVVFLRDRDAGEVRVGRDGHPVVQYRISRYDRAHVRAGVAGAARILEAAGARRVFRSHAGLAEYRPGRRGDVGTLLAAADDCGWGAGQCAYTSVHSLCSARMGDSPRDSACDPTGTTWEAAGLVVCDGSALPTAPGVNPMISIEAVAHMNARALAARLA